MDSDTTRACCRYRLGSVDHANLVNVARTSMEAMGRSACDIFFDVCKGPDVHGLVFSRTGKEIFLVVSDGDCVDWILVLVKRGHQ